MAAATSTTDSQAGKAGDKASTYPLDSHNRLSSAGRSKRGFLEDRTDKIQVLLQTSNTPSPKTFRGFLP